MKNKDLCPSLSVQRQSKSMDPQELESKSFCDFGSLWP